MIPPDEGLVDLNTPTVNQDYGLPEEQDINPLQPNDINHKPEVQYDNLDDIDPLQNPQEHLEPDQPQPPEPIEPEVSDQGAYTSHDRPQRTRTSQKPKRISVPYTDQILGGAQFESQETGRPSRVSLYINSLFLQLSADTPYPRIV
jgi:hypothetical protein